MGRQLSLFLTTRSIDLMQQALKEYGEHHQGYEKYCWGLNTEINNQTGSNFPKPNYTW